MMKEKELQQAIAAQIKEASGGHHSEIMDSRADLFDRYMGEPYGDEDKTRSHVIDSTISDTVEWIMPELMEIFTGSDKVCQFEPQGPEDEEAAEQETDAVNYVFYRQNDGFIELYQYLKDGLIQKNGYAKRWWETREKVSTEEYRNLTEEDQIQLAQRIMQEGGEKELEEEEINEDGTVNVKVKITYQHEQLRVECVPPEEILVSPRWHQVNLDNCPFVAHRRPLTASELTEMGYSRKQIEKLPESKEQYLSQEKIDRFTTRGSAEYDQDIGHDPAMREVTIHECYMYIDRNEDGIAELCKITVGGDAEYEILRWEDGNELDIEEVDYIPISAWTPVVIPHRHYGRSVAELVEDLQRIKTALFRQMLDNVYLNNNATKEIAEPGIIDGTTIEDLLFARPGKIVRTAEVGNYIEHRPPSLIADSLQALEYADTVRENRSGVNRYNQGMDADSLNKTASGMRQIMQQGQKKILLIARIFAETGLRHLIRGIHTDLRKNAGKKIKMRLRNQYVEVDPRMWRDRSDMTVGVGLGNGDRETQTLYLQQIIAEQKENIQLGSPLADVSKLFNSYQRYVEVAGFKNPEEFFVNPATIPPAPEEPPEPNQFEHMMLIETMKAKTDQETKLLMKQIEMQGKSADLEQERDKLLEDARQHQADLEMKAQELALKEREIELKLADIQSRAQLAQDNLAIKVSQEDDQAKVDAILQQNKQLIAEMGEKFREGLKEMGDAVERGISKPKRVVRDSEGNVTGVE